MKLLVAKSAGFCFGVKRAMDMALEAAEKDPKASTRWVPSFIIPKPWNTLRTGCEGEGTD